MQQAQQITQLNDDAPPLGAVIASSGRHGVVRQKCAEQRAVLREVSTRLADMHELGGEVGDSGLADVCRGELLICIDRLKDIRDKAASPREAQRAAKLLNQIYSTAGRLAQGAGGGTTVTVNILSDPDAARRTLANLGVIGAAGQVIDVEAEHGDATSGEGGDNAAR